MKNGIKPNPEITGEMKPKLKYDGHQSKNSTADLSDEFLEQAAEKEPASDTINQEPADQNHTEQMAAPMYSEPHPYAAPNPVSADPSDADIYYEPSHADSYSMPNQLNQKKSKAILFFGISVVLIGIIAFCIIYLISGKNTKTSPVVIEQIEEQVIIEKPMETLTPVPTNSPIPTITPGAAKTESQTTTPGAAETESQTTTPATAETESQTTTPGAVETESQTTPPPVAERTDPEKNTDSYRNYDKSR